MAHAAGHPQILLGSRGLSQSAEGAPPARAVGGWSVPVVLPGVANVAGNPPGGSSHCRAKETSSRRVQAMQEKKALSSRGRGRLFLEHVWGRSHVLEMLEITLIETTHPGQVPL